MVTLGGGVAGGILGNFSDRLMCRGSDWVMARFAERLRRGELPANHDLARTVREAQLDGVAALAHKYASILKTDDYGIDRTAQIALGERQDFERKIMRWVDAKKKKLRRGVLSESECRLAEIAATKNNQRLLSDPHLGSAEQRIVRAWIEAGKLTLEEIRASKSMKNIPEEFVAAMEGRGNLEGVTWANATLSLFAEALKKDENTPAFRVVMLDLVQELGLDNQKFRGEIVQCREQILAAIQRETGPVGTYLRGMDKKLDAIGDDLKFVMTEMRDMRAQIAELTSAVQTIAHQ